MSRLVSYHGKYSLLYIMVICIDLMYRKEFSCDYSTWSVASLVV